MSASQVLYQKKDLDEGRLFIAYILSPLPTISELLKYWDDDNFSTYDNFKASIYVATCSLLG
jgi:hypothetical protein